MQPLPYSLSLAASRGYRQPQWNGVMTALTWVSVGSAAAFALLSWRRRRMGRARSLPHRMTQCIALALAGVAVNALVCGLLASPLDRFQARVVWVLPLAAWLAALARHPRAVHRQPSPKDLSPQAFASATDARLRPASQGVRP